MNQLFDQDLAAKRPTVSAEPGSTVIPLHPRNRHLH
jgi:hypothetical protein